MYLSTKKSEHSLLLSTVFLKFKLSQVFDFENIHRNNDKILKTKSSFYWDPWYFGLSVLQRAIDRKKKSVLKLITSTGVCAMMHMSSQLWPQNQA